MYNFQTTTAKIIGFECLREFRNEAFSKAKREELLALDEFELK